VCVGYSTPASRNIDRVPALSERVRSGWRAECFYGTADVPNFLRTPHGPGWALVGDAACHKDPYMALGICDSLRDAELLAEAIDEGLSGRRPLDEALADYERWRNEATLAEYKQNLQLARLLPPPVELMQLRAALRGDQEITYLLGSFIAFATEWSSCCWRWLSVTFFRCFEQPARDPSLRVACRGFSSLDPDHNRPSPPLDRLEQ
jgi:hypothetical protein